MRLKGLLKTLQRNKTPFTANPGIETNAVEDGTIEENVRYLEWLMTWYCQRPSPFIARVIVCRLEALHAREQEGESLFGAWSCQRLIRSWQYIADHQRSRG